MHSLLKGSFFYCHLWTEILCAILTLRSSVVWDVAQRVLLVSYRRFGQPTGSIFKGQAG
jgi:hypothetical protein